LTSLDPSLFVSQQKLLILALQDNKLPWVDVELLKPLVSLMKFNLSGNPLVCDLAFRHVWLWLNAHGLKLLATCQLPPTIKTVAVTEQLENVTRNTDKIAEVTSNAPNKHIQSENTCDVRTLSIWCLTFLIIIAFAPLI
jgi:hypothetical protein